MKGERVFIELMTSDPTLKSVQRGLEIKDLQDLKDFDYTRCKTYNRRINYRTEVFTSRLY